MDKSNRRITQVMYTKNALNISALQLNQNLTRVLNNLYTTGSLSNICVKHIPVSSRVWARDEFLLSAFGHVIEGRG